MIKVLVLRHKRSKKSNQRLAWLIFHKIYCMYIDISNKEEINAAMLLTSMSYHKEPNRVNEETEDSCDNNDNNKPNFQKRIIPSYLNDIQPRATQVWNCGEVGFDPNERWIKVICTYKFCQGELMWKVQNGERASSWCTLLVFTQADGKCFMPPIIVHQAKDCSQDLHYNIPLDWIVHHTPYGYMDRDGWLKSMT